MSASVFNPLLISELRHTRTAGVADRVTDNRTPSFAALSSLRRNLFGAVDTDECREFIKKELEQTLVNQSEYWEFDFKNDMPKADAVRFEWEPIEEKQTSRPAKRPYREYDDFEEMDISSLYFSPIEELNGSEEKPKSKMRLQKMKQPRITDFLKNIKASNAFHHKVAKKMLATPTQPQLRHRIKS